MTPTTETEDTLQDLLDDPEYSAAIRHYLATQSQKSEREFMATALDDEIILVNRAENYEQDKIEGEGGYQEDDDFLAEELLIAAILGKAIKTAAGTFIDDLITTLKTDMSRLDDLLSVTSETMQEALTYQDENRVRNAVYREIRKGANKAATFSAISDSRLMNDIAEGMVTSAKYYTNNYFNRFVLPALQDKVEEYLILKEADTAGYKAIREAMEDRLKSAHYWRIVANASASRSYHYGLLKGAQANGQTGYRFEAVLDNRTTPICRELHGREFWIADAVSLVERIALADSVEEVKDIAPWVKASDVKSMGVDRLAELGVMIPPLHALCRSSIVPIG